MSAKASSVSLSHEKMSSVGSDWKLTNGAGYILDRDRSHAAASRLNLQFYLWKDSLGFNIHPTISQSLFPSTKSNELVGSQSPVAICEVASGTGIWLTDVARSVPPSTILTGLDYNLSQSPPAAWLPPNMSMRHWNVFDPVPEDLVGKYDYVHTRLLVLVVGESKDPGPIIRNIFKLLKPGGWLQWDELDTVNMSIQKVDPALETPALEELRKWSWADGRLDWTVKLPEFMEKEGFTEVKGDLFGDPPALARAFTEQHLLTAEEFAEGLIKLGKREVGEKYFGLVHKAHQEAIEGAALCVPRIVCVGRKPL
ncbi:hypothetical protein QC763_610390 [Podospora pseudopauciseta]|uniref:Methyltransferase domain-containing protein n=2 Tax=Podospora TaxID=5144 RepID=A0ABR0H6Q5_9PEZI|nr:hypothetical protein QC763_610390 [Podospora pseudopauciseta]KAK4671976.1 hypothetical protein QC764_610390 [Podospora pseudoanserina]